MKEMTPEKPVYYASVSRRILLIFVVVSFLPLLIITGSVLYQSHFFYREKVRSQLEYLAKLHTQNIDTFLTERLNNIRFLASSGSFEQLSDEAFLTKTLARLQQEYGAVFSDLGVVNENGKQIAYAGPYKLEAADYAQASWFQAALGGETHVSDVFLGLRGLPHFIVTVKKLREGRPWILRATIDFRSFNDLVGNLRIGTTGFAFILNRAGEFQTEVSASSSVITSASRELFEENWDRVGDGVHFSERNDLTGIDTVYVSAPLKDGQWLMILQQFSKDAFSDLRRTRAAALINLVLGSVCILVAGIVLSRLVARRLNRVDQEKEIMNQQIVESGKLASLGELAAGIAHEINNPVAIMVEEAGWIGDLLDDDVMRRSESYGEFRRALTQIKTQGVRCRDITQKLLSFARKSENRRAVAHVNDLIAEVVGISEQHAKYNNVSIRTLFADDLPLIEVSQTEVQQVMLNLINNAMDAMEKTGGKIEIETSCEEEEIVVRVSDTGPGIPEAYLGRIFDPFFTTKPVGKGTGLGLSICYGIVRRMGGKIMVRSKDQEGTTFLVHLPVGERADGPGE
jgi:two-component system NtrC family sensor kinase